jgi:hypothetical protein
MMPSLLQCIAAVAFLAMAIATEVKWDSLADRIRSPEYDLARRTKQPKFYCLTNADSKVAGQVRDGTKFYQDRSAGHSDADPSGFHAPVRQTLRTPHLIYLHTSSPAHSTARFIISHEIRRHSTGFRCSMSRTTRTTARSPATSYAMGWRATSTATTNSPRCTVLPLTCCTMRLESGV